MTDARDRDRGAHQALRRRDRRRRRARPAGAPRRGLRLPRAQRRRQDDDAADAARARAPDVRRRRPCSARRPARRTALARHRRDGRGARPSTRTSRAATTCASSPATPASTRDARRRRARRGRAERDRAGDRVGTYSMGMKQRLGVAAALLKDPELLILDEPTNGLDPAGMAEMRAFIRSLAQGGRTVVLSSHLMGEVEQVSDRVGVIRDGALVAEGTVGELRGRAGLRVRAEPLGEAARLDRRPARGRHVAARRRRCSTSRRHRAARRRSTGAREGGRRRSRRSTRRRDLARGRLPRAHHASQEEGS